MEKLLDRPVVYASHPFAKKGPINQYFHLFCFEDATVLKKGFLHHIPAELLDGCYRADTYTDTLYPASDSMHFKGQVYVLVSGAVFSSSEGFAQFCKAIDWASLAGERTGVDGIGSDPAMICLPESAMLMTFPVESGLNYDGAINFEKTAVPDIEFPANTARERLPGLLHYLDKHAG